MLKIPKLFFVNYTKILDLYLDIGDRESSCKFTKYIIYAGALLKKSLTYVDKLYLLVIYSIANSTEVFQTSLLSIIMGILVLKKASLPVAGLKKNHSLSKQQRDFWHFQAD